MAIVEEREDTSGTPGRLPDGLSQEHVDQVTRILEDKQKAKNETKEDPEGPDCEKPKKPIGHADPVWNRSYLRWVSVSEKHPSLSLVWDGLKWSDFTEYKQSHQLEAPKGANPLTESGKRTATQRVFRAVTNRFKKIMGK